MLEKFFESIKLLSNLYTYRLTKQVADKNHMEKFLNGLLQYCSSNIFILNKKI